jgi:hypothetical protein
MKTQKLFSSGNKHSYTIVGLTILFIVCFIILILVSNQKSVTETKTEPIQQKIELLESHSIVDYIIQQDCNVIMTRDIKNNIWFTVTPRNNEMEQQLLKKHNVIETIKNENHFSIQSSGTR